MSSLSEEDCRRILDPERQQEFREMLGDERFETQRSRAHMTLLAYAQQKQGWHLFGTPHDGCPCAECTERYKKIDAGRTAWDVDVTRKPVIKARLHEEDAPGNIQWPNTKRYVYEPPPVEWLPAYKRWAEAMAEEEARLEEPTVERSPDISAITRDIARGG